MNEFVTVSESKTVTAHEIFNSIDLDDGVKNNYEIFKDVLAKIK